MPFQAFTQKDFSRGVDDVSHPSAIADNQIADAWNFEFLKTGKGMKVRRGTEEMFRHGGGVTSVYAFKPTGSTDTHNILTLFALSPNCVFTLNSDGTLTNRSGTFSNVDAHDPFQWATMNNLAIAVRLKTAMTPQRWNGTDAAFTNLGGTPPNGRLIEIWNSRAWMADQTNKNRLYFSKVGDSENWTATGVSGAGYIEVGYNDGDDIIGLKAHHERLWIFKRSHIYVIITANPNTDNTLWRVELFTKEGGCASGLSIQPFNNDLIFLSDVGVISLRALEMFGDFEKALVSRGLDIVVNPMCTNYPSVVLPDKSQYWLSARDSKQVQYLGSDTVLWDEAEHTTTFVLDYDEMAQVYRWTKFRFYTGEVNNNYPPVNHQWVPISSYGVITFGDKQHVLMGSGWQSFLTNTYPVYIYPNRATDIEQKYNDAWKEGVTTGKYLRQIKTKTFDFGLPSHRKLLNEFALGVRLKRPTTTTVNINVTYTYDDWDRVGGTSSNRYRGAVEIAISPTVNGIYKMDQTVWAPFGAFAATCGRQCESMNMTITSTAAGQAFELRHITIEAQPLDKKYLDHGGTLSAGTPITVPLNRLDQAFSDE